MIYTKRQTSKGKTKIVELTEDTKFFTKCAVCGKELEETEAILDNFSDFLYGASRMYCEECGKHHETAKNKKPLLSGDALRSGKKAITQIAYMLLRLRNYFNIFTGLLQQERTKNV